MYPESSGTRPAESAMPYGVGGAGARSTRSERYAGKPFRYGNYEDHKEFHKHDPCCRYGLLFSTLGVISLILALAVPPYYQRFYASVVGTGLNNSEIAEFSCEVRVAMHWFRQYCETNGPECGDWEQAFQGQDPSAIDGNLINPGGFCEFFPRKWRDQEDEDERKFSFSFTFGWILASLILLFIAWILFFLVPALASGFFIWFLRFLIILALICALIAAIYFPTSLPNDFRQDGCLSNTIRVLDADVNPEILSLWTGPCTEFIGDRDAGITTDTLFFFYQLRWGSGGWWAIVPALAFILGTLIASVALSTV